MRSLCLLFILLPFIAMADPSPPRPVYFEHTITTIAEHPSLEVSAAKRYPTGAVVPFYVKNTGSKALRIEHDCHPVVLRDAKNRLLDTDHEARYQKRSPPVPIDLEPGASAVVCRWDGAASFEVDGQRARKPLPAGRYEFVLRGRVSQAQSPLELGGSLAAPFELVAPKVFALDE